MLFFFATTTDVEVLVTEVLNWSVTDDSNTDIAPENMKLGNVNNAIRAMQGAIKRWQQGSGDKYVAPAGLVGTPSYTWAGSTTTGWWSPAANTMAYSVSGAEKFRIDTSGHFRIGNTTDIGPGKVQVTFAPASSQIGFTCTPLTNTSNAAFHVFLNEAGATIGSITRNAATNAVLFNTTSDARLKTVTGSVTGSLIDQLNPVTFVWKDTPDQGERHGFLAQELDGIIPGVVTPGDDEKPWMVDVSGLIPVIVAALKDLRTRVAALESA